LELNGVETYLNIPPKAEVVIIPPPPEVFICRRALEEIEQKGMQGLRCFEGHMTHMMCFEVMWLLRWERVRKQLINHMTYHVGSGMRESEGAKSAMFY
jgi:hypothetical protein